MTADIGPAADQRGGHGVKPGAIQDLCTKRRSRRSMAAFAVKMERSGGDNHRMSAFVRTLSILQHFTV
jgi:hypothetical protein